MVRIPYPVGTCLSGQLMHFNTPLFFRFTMDTIIRKNPHLHTIEHAVLPAAAPKLSLYQRCVTRASLMIEDFFARHICCVPSNLVEDWEFDNTVRQTVVAMRDDDVDFSEIVEYYNLARTGEQVERQFAVEREVGDLLQNEAGWLHTNGPTPAVSKAHELWLPSDEDSTQVGVALVEREVKLRRKVKARRRRKRVVAYVVVALINKIRCKYYHMDDNPANRRLIGSYLLKLMREHNFRTCDIPCHVEYAVDLYFEVCTTKMKPAAYARM